MKQKPTDSSHNPKKNKVNFNLIVPILVQIALLWIDFDSFS